MPLRNIILVAVAVSLLLLFMSVFIVREDETAIRFQFGQIVQTDYQPGLHFKWPLVNNVRKFDARVQTLDMEPERFLTVEKKNLIVDSFVKWRINNAERFYTAVAGSVFRANQRLDQNVKNGLRSEFSRRTLNDVVSGDRTQVMEILSQTANQDAQRFGIEVLEVRLKRVDLPEEVSESVFARMRAERERVARDFRSRGREEAERVRADADRQRTVLLAEAFRDAEVIRGEGDAQATDTYARAYNKDEEFYSFYRSLNAYRNGFSSQDDILVLQPDESGFFRFFSNPGQSFSPSPAPTAGRLP